MFNKCYHDVDMNTGSFQKLMDVVVEMDSDHFQEPLYRLTKTRGRDFTNFAFTKFGKSIGLPPVLCHGDFWCANMLFDTQNPSQVKAIIDPQVAFAGDVSSDL